MEDILGGSGRTKTLAEVEIASPGAADPFLTVTHLTIPIISNRSTKKKLGSRRNKGIRSKTNTTLYL